MNFNKEDKLIKELCSIFAPSGKELPVKNYIYNYIKDYNLTIIDEDRNKACPFLIVVEGKANKEPILLSAHMDSVTIKDTNKVTLIEDGDMLKTDGTCVLGGDDRLGIACALLMIDYAINNKDKISRLEVLFTTEEEIGSKGSRTFDFSTIKAKTGYNLDGETSVGTAIYQAPHKIQFTIEVFGKSSHAALEPENGINAITNIAKLVTQIPQGLLKEGTTCNIGIIEGGKQTNIVPNYAKVTGELRSIYPKDFDYYKQEIEKVSENYNSKLTWNECYLGYKVDINSNCVKMFEKACKIHNYEMKLVTSQGGGDANNINNRNIEQLVFGLAMHNIHSKDEYLLFSEYHKALDLLKTLVFKL